MSLPPPRATPEGPSRVLTCAAPEGRQVEIVEHHDGTLSIRVEGMEIPEFRWKRGQVESCVHTYLRLLGR